MPVRMEEKLTEEPYRWASTSRRQFPRAIKATFHHERIRVLYNGHHSRVRKINRSKEILETMFSMLYCIKDREAPRQS